MGPPRLWVHVALLLLGIAALAVPASAQKTPAKTGVHVRTLAAAAVASDVGQWGSVLSWPLVSVHSVLQPSGQVLVWDGFGNGPNSQRLWDPASGTFTAVPNANNLFCGGQLALADGRTIVVGGHVSPNNGLTQTNLFDPATKSWTRGADMSKARWYPTGTTLPDGRILVVSGDSIQQDDTLPITPLSIHSNDTPEIYNPRLNSWTSLPTAARAIPLYPFMFVLPDGRVLDAGPEQQSRTLNLTTGTWSPLAVSPIDGHSAVMYRPGKVLKTGKWTDPDYKDLAVHGWAAVLDTTVATPAWREVAPMASPRSYHTLVALPDGNVLSVGGGRTSEGTILANGVLTPEIWNASTETWTSLAPMQTSRLYHSTALLLPDARILVSGGGALPGSAIDQTSAEVYSPPYLFRGPRPTITSAPSTVQYTTTFSVATPDASRIASVALLRTPAVTHAFDQNQRYVPLTFAATSGGLDVKAPVNGNIAPPGYYMLFIVDTNGVPSVASFVRLPAPWEDSVAPSAPSGLAATGGLGSIGLMWTPAVDNTAVTGYDIHRSTTPAFTPSAANRVAQTTLTTFTDTGLAPGTHYYVVVARDAAGNSSAPSNVAFATATAETVPPAVSITAPGAGATVAGVVTVTAAASDNVALAGVRFFADGAAIGAEDTTAPYSADWNTGTLANDTHTLTAVARDAAGNTATSAAVSVQVANTGSAGLVASYSFDEGAGATVEDGSGNANDGTISGAVWSAAGRFGGALSFGGMGDWVTVADSPSLDLTDGMTLEAWVLPVQFGGIWRTVLLKEQPGDLVYGLYAATDASLPDGVVYASGSEHEALDSSQLPINAWSHLAVTYDGAALRLYVDGVLEASNTVSGAIPNSDGALRIGGNAVWGEYFDGLIDELRVYSRALTAAEIQTDMNTPVTPPPAPPPPADSTPPTAPAGLSANGSLGTVSLAWTASSDDVGVVSYNVHRSTTPGFAPSTANLVAQPNGTSYTDAGLAPGIYYYRVTAVDAAGNVSASSAEATGNASDRTPPTAPGALSATGTLGRVSLTWSASTDDVAVVRYNVHRSTLSGFVPSATNRVAQVAGTSYVDAGLVPGVYYYRVTAEDAAGNVSTPSAQAAGNATDTSPPSVPAGLTAVGSPGTVKLTWSASTDNVSVVGYDVYRSTFAGFTPSAANRVAHPTGTSYTDAGLTAGVYYYRVTAVDGSGNVSAPSAEVSANAADASAPSAPAGLTATGSPGTVGLAWSASTDDVGVVGYSVYRSTTSGFAPTAANRIAQPTGTSYTDTGLGPGTYYYRVTAVDAAGNVSAPSAQAQANVPDTSPPSAPAALTATGSLGMVELAWSAASDNVGVVRYNVHRSVAPGFVPDASNLVAQPTGTSYTDAALTPGVYYYLVTAVDAAGNVSAPSEPATGIAAADTSPPSAPAGLSATSSFGKVELAWSASGDDVAVVRYNVHRSVEPGFVPDASNLVARPTGPSYTDSALAPGVYHYVITAADAAGNVSDPSAEVTGDAATDNIAPSAPGGLSATGSLGTVELAWIASTDDVGVDHYNVYRSDTPGFVPDTSSLVAQPVGTTYTDADLTPGVYYYRVTAEDAQGNVGAPSVQAAGDASDTVSPAAPDGLSATASPGTISLAWSAPSDNVGVAGYSVHRSTTPSFAPTAGNRIARPTDTSYTDSGLAPGTYYYLVTAEDAAGNVSSPSAVTTGTVADTSAPSAPAGVAATGSLFAVSLSWSASSDDVAVVHYNVHRSQTPGFVPNASNLVARPSGTSYQDSPLTPGAYYYVVTAEDAAGNVSVPSTQSTGVAAADTSPPSPPGALTATASPGVVSLSWSASSDNVKVVRYNVHRSQTSGFVPAASNVVAQPTGTSYTDSGLAPGTYYYRVTAEDAAGNVSPASAEASGSAGDLSAPVVALLSPAVGSTVIGSVAVTASASDNVGVRGVQFRLDGVNLGAEDTAAPYAVTWDTRLTIDGRHELTAIARDAAGNESTSAPVGVTVDNLRGLVAAYSFDADSGTMVADVSGNGNAGVISSATWWPSGRFGGALLFDNQAFVSVADSASLDLTGAMTIEAWLRPTQTGSYRTVAVKEGPGSIVYGLYASTRTTASGGDVGPTGDVMIGGTEILARGPDKLQTDVWTHLAVTYDGTTLRVYEDGNLVASRIAIGTIATSSGALRIGGNLVRGEFYRGLIDELRIYRRALASTEVRSDMNVPIGS